MRLRLLILVLSVFFLSLGGEVSSEETHSLDRLREELARQWDEIQSMQGSYGFEQTADELAERHNAMRNLSVRSKVAFARSEKKRMVRVQDENIGPDMQVRNNTFKVVYDGSEYRHRRGKSFLIQASRSGSIDGNVYIGQLMRPQNDEQAAAAQQNPDKTHLIPYCFQSRAWKLRPQIEQVDGCSCLVAENDAAHSRLYFDVQRGYCLVRAEAEFEPKKTDTTCVIKRTTEYKNHRKVLGSLHLPMEIAGTVSLVNREGKPAGTLKWRTLITDLSVNDVRDSVFAPMMPQVGDRVVDSIRNQSYQYTAGDQRALDLAAEGAAAPLVPRWRRVVVYALSFAIGLVGFVIFVLRWRMKQR